MRSSLAFTGVEYAASSATEGKTNFIEQSNDRELPCRKAARLLGWGSEMNAWLAWNPLATIWSAKDQRPG